MNEEKQQINAKDTSKPYTDRKGKEAFALLPKNLNQKNLIKSHQLFNFHLSSLALKTYHLTHEPQRQIIIHC